LAFSIACRREPIPLSAVVVTVNVMPLLLLASKTLIQTENSSVRKRGVVVETNKLIVVVHFFSFVDPAVIGLKEGKKPRDRESFFALPRIQIVYLEAFYGKLSKSVKIRIASLMIGGDISSSKCGKCAQMSLDRVLYECRVSPH
jgi:hypothetical protein